MTTRLTLLRVYGYGRCCPAQRIRAPNEVAKRVCASYARRRRCAIGASLVVRILGNETPTVRYRAMDRPNSALYLYSGRPFLLLASPFHLSIHLPLFSVTLHRSLFTSVAKLLFSTFPVFSDFFWPYYFFLIFHCAFSGE